MIAIDEQPVIDEQPLAADPKERAKRIEGYKKTIEAKSNVEVQGPFGRVGTMLAGPVQRVADVPMSVLNTPTILGNALLPGQDAPLPFQRGVPALPLQVPQDANIIPALRPVAEGLADTISGFTTPENLLAAPLAGANVGKLTAPLAATFLGQMAAQLPQETVDTLSTLRDANIPHDEKLKRATELVLNAGITGLGSAGMLHEANKAEPGVGRIAEQQGPTAVDLADITEGQERVPPSRQLTDSKKLVSPQGTVIDEKALSPKELADFYRESQAESRQTESGQQRVVNTVSAGLEKQGTSAAKVEDLQGVKQPPMPGAQVGQVAPDLVFREEFEKAETKRFVPGKDETQGDKATMTEGEKERLRNFQTYLSAEKDIPKLERLRASLKPEKAKNRFEQEFIQSLDRRLGQKALTDKEVIASDVQEKEKGQEDVLGGKPLLPTGEEGSNKPRNPGGSQEALPEELLKQSKAANSKAAWGDFGGFNKKTPKVEDKGTTEPLPGRPVGDAAAHAEIMSTASDKLKSVAKDMGIVPGATGYDVAQAIAEKPEKFGKEGSALAQFLVDHFEHVLRPAKVDPRRDPNFKEERGAYYTGKGNQGLDHVVFADLNEGTVDTQHFRVLHELTHAATAWQLEYPKTRTQRLAVKELKGLVEKAKDGLPADVKSFFKEIYEPGKKAGTDESRLAYEAKQRGVDYEKWVDTLYGLQNHHEMVANTFESSEFRSFLNNIEVENKSLFHRIVDKVKDVLGIKSGSIVDRTFDNLMEVGAEREWGDRTSQGLTDFPGEEAFGGRPVKERMDKAADDLKRDREGFKGWWQGKTLRRDTIPAMKNRADNKAFVMARQTANDVNDRLAASIGKVTKALKTDGVERNALTFVIEAGGDASKLNEMKSKLSGLTKYWARDAKEAVQYALDNLAKLKPVADFYKRVNQHMVKLENDAGVPTEFRKDYVPHVQDLRDVNSILFEGGGKGVASGFTKTRTFSTYADSLKAGYKPVSLDAVKLLENRMATGQRRANTANMVEDLKSVVDPATKEPIIKPLTLSKKPVSGRTETLTPQGYKNVFIGNHAVAVHKGYAGLLENLTGESAFDKSTVGRAVMNSVSTAKHVGLLFDLFHPVRLFVYSSPLRASAKSPLEFLKNPKSGLLVLDYNKPTLERMAARGEIDKALLPEILRKKDIAATAIKTGFNVGKISENLYSEFVEKLPGFGHYNKWLFDRFQRGLMMETYSVEFDRRKAMEPSLSNDEVGAKVSKELNIKFGNMMAQSWVKSKTMQDVLRLVFLAPQWNEGLIRSEVGAVRQGGDMVMDALARRRLVSGALVRDSGIIWAAMFLGNQFINYLSRGKPTWENTDDQPGAKISAFIPDKLGKSDGYFLNPFSLSAEVTHTLAERFAKDQSWTEAAHDFFQNKLSSSGRALDVLLEQEDWQKNHLKDWALVKEAAKEGAPVPIQAPAVVHAFKGKESYPGEAQRSLMGGLGVKTDRVVKSKEQRLSEEDGGKPYAEMNVAEREQAAKAVAAKRGPMSIEGKEAGLRKHGEAMAEQGRALAEAMPDRVRGFLDEHRLSLPGYEPELQKGRLKIPLTKDEMAFETKLINDEYEKRITAFMDNPNLGKWTTQQKQEHLNQLLTAAKHRVKAEVKRKINSAG